MFKKLVLFLYIILTISIFSTIALSYGVNPSTNPTHQYIANESGFVWLLIPFEIENYLNHDIYDDLDNWGYQANENEDIIVGSGEEDRDFSIGNVLGGCITGMPYCEHFWEPDNPKFGKYGDGLWWFESSYIRAKGIWQSKIIPYYIKGDIDKSYYWLGRVVHLLEDATVPAHMHKDAHFSVFGDDSLEEYMADHYSDYKGSNYENNQYNYEDLPNMDNFDWSQVDAKDKQNIELFRLFWYTAQKTQYYASDDVDGNSVYYNLNNQQQSFSTSLWQGDNVEIINDQTQVAANVSKIANATIPHAMKAVAGLYRLFWDAVKIDWPFYHHDLRRTGFTLLKGDMDKDSKDEAGWTIDRNIDATFYDFPSVADIDGDGKMEILTATSKTKGSSLSGLEGKFLVLECIKSGNKCKSFREKWSIERNNLTIDKAPSVDDLDNDGRKEIVFIAKEGGGDEGTVYAFDTRRLGRLDARRNSKWNYDVPTESGQIDAGDIGHTAIADIDLDGKKEILFADGYGNTPLTFQGRLYILKENGDLQQKIALGTASVGGSVLGAIAIADVNGNDYPDIVLPNEYGIMVYEYNSSSQQVEKLWNNSDAEIVGTAVIADVDSDNKYEIVYVTSNNFCNVASCSNTLYVVDAETGTQECARALVAQPNPNFNSVPSVANLDSDSNLEIVVITRQSGVGKIYSYDGSGTCPLQNSYPSSDIDTTNAFSDIVDIDNDGSNDVIFSLSNGTLDVLSNTLTKKWSYNLGGQIAGAPAIADLDGDGVAEIAAKRLTSSSSSVNRVFSSIRDFEENYDPEVFRSLADVDMILTLVGGNNTQPELSYIDDIYTIEGNFVNVTPTATDEDSDPLTFYYSSPLNASQDNKSGTWQTNDSSSGIYELFIEASDNNLTDSQFITLTVYESGTELENNFSDGENFKELNYTQASNKTVYVTLPKDVNISRAALKLNGSSLSEENNTYQEPAPVIIEANELNNSLNSSLIIDNDWSSYYSAGSATGAIVEIGNLTVPQDIKHIIFHLKLRVYGGGSGRFGVYNYNTQKYEIVTSSILPFNNLSKDIYFDIYEDNPLWASNDTAFSMKVENLNDYISSNKTRWYYRYLGDWASQMIYESEVKFEGNNIYPQIISLDVGNDSTVDYNINGELYGSLVKINRFNNSNKNETINLGANQSATRYITVPKNALLTNALIRMGNKEVETLSDQEELAKYRAMQAMKNKKGLIERGKDYNVYNNDDGTATTSIHTSPINYHNGIEYVPIDTKIVSSQTNWDYEVTKGVYQAYFKADPSAEQTIKIQKDDSYLIFKPENLIYKSSLGEQQISNVKSINTILLDNKLTYDNMFGNGLDLYYEYLNAELKENLVIDNFDNLPIPQTQISNQDLTLDLEFVIDYSQDTKLYIDGIEWDKSSTVKTNKEIEIRKGNEIMFYLPRSYAYDSQNKRQLLSSELRKEGINLYLTIKVPYSFLENANFPVMIDPSTKVDISLSMTVDKDNDWYCDNIKPNSYSVDPSRSLLKFPLSSLPHCKEINISAARVWVYDNVDDIILAECSDYSLRMIWKTSDSWNCGLGLSWSDASYIVDNVLDTVCAYNDGTWYSWNVFNNGDDDIVEDYEINCDTTTSFIMAFVKEDASAGNGVIFNTNAYLNVTYTLIPNDLPVLVGCSDAYTEKDSDGSDISVDLWDCHYDGDDAAENSTFSILSETNISLIDCSVTSNRFVTCGAPSASKTGYSDVTVQVSDGQYTDNDTLRIYVREPGNVSIYVNNTAVYNGKHWEYADLNLFSDIENYLEICENNSKGDCQIPIKIQADDADINFSINSIDITYDLREIEFSDSLEDYLKDDCLTDTCNVSLTFGLSSEGQLDLSNLQIFYSEIIPPNVTLNQPSNGSTILDSEMPVIFNFSVISDSGVNNCSLWGDFSGSWSLNQTYGGIKEDDTEDAWSYTGSWYDPLYGANKSVDENWSTLAELTSQDGAIYENFTIPIDINKANWTFKALIENNFNISCFNISNAWQTFFSTPYNTTVVNRTVGIPPSCLNSSIMEIRTMGGATMNYYEGKADWIYEIENNITINFNPINLPIGNYIWNVQCQDSNKLNDWGDGNFTLNVQQSITKNTTVDSFILSYGGTSGSTSTHNITATLNQQPIGTLTSSTHIANLGWWYYNQSS